LSASVKQVFHSAYLNFAFSFTLVYHTVFSGSLTGLNHEDAVLLGCDAMSLGV
jgi:hypothetical protein